MQKKTIKTPQRIAPRRAQRIALCLATLIPLLCACASMGNPQGGLYDETPPKVVRCTPDNKATNNRQKRITLLFDEYIKLENASEKLVVSPPQKEMPDIRPEGKRISIELFDTLQENTTYTIDFGDAIVDNNEGNPMGQFTYSFSTGDKIDTMEVSGHVLNAEDLEPIKGILVGLHREGDSTAFRTRPFLRVARTNGSGFFSIKGIAPGRYHAFALQDADGDFLFNQKSEQIAFDTTIIVPTSTQATRQDTIWHDSLHIDSIRYVPYTRFLPNDIVLRAFKEAGQEQHLLKIERPVPDRFTVFFTAPSDTLPTIKGFNFNPETAFLLEASANKDTLTYWIKDTLVAHLDTLKFSLTYLETDTLGQLSLRTDSMELAAKRSRARIEKELNEKIEKWKKENERLRKKGFKVPNQNPFEKSYMLPQLSNNGNMAPNKNITITFPQPIEKVDSTLFTFQKKVDTLWVDEPYLLLPVEGTVRSYRLYAEWKPGQEYAFTADTAAFTDIFGTESNKVECKVKISPLESFGALFIHLAIPDTQAVVQLLDASGKVAQSVTTNKNRADFFFLQPATYYVRAFIDTNGNGVWDTGCYDEGLQPEPMYYFPKAIPIKVRMEIEQEWDPTSIPLTKQKAPEITKQKPDQEKKIQNRNKDYKK